MNRSKAAVLAAVVVSSVQWASAQDTLEKRLEELEQRHAILERKLEVGEEGATRQAAEGSAVVAGKDGFSLKSNDGQFALKIAGYIHTDHRDYLADRDAYADQFLLRRARLQVDGLINKTVDFRVLTDFANGGGTSGSSLLQDAYVNFNLHKLAQVRVGKFKPAVGLERLRSINAISFVELGLPTALVPNRDTGVQLAADVAGGLWSYQLGVFNGVPDGGSTESDTNDGKDYAARLFVHPFKKTDWDTLTDLGLGVAGTIGDQKGTTASAQLPTIRTSGQQTLYAYTQAGSFANGRRTRVSPQLYWFAGSASLLGEYVLSEQEVTRATTTTTTDRLANRAWQVAGTWVLTGEKTSYKGLKPRRSFDPKTGAWGAFELVARYGEFLADADAFPRYASAAAQPKRARNWTGGFNWYPTAAVRVMSNYEYTSFEGGAATGDRRPERAVISRVQLVF